MDGLVGRTEEKAALDQLLDAARHGLSGTIVLRGEPGVGKTALIDYTISRADDFLVVPFTGLKSEHDLGYAALHRLLTPILHQIERLPPPQRDALTSALGLADGPPASPFLVGLGTISLAANAARARHRLLTVIDDAHWVDRESIEALAFWGRRIRADGIALVFATRDTGSGIDALDSFETFEVSGLPPVDAKTLLEREFMHGVDGQVADRIILETEGNPLALIELAHSIAGDRWETSTLGPQPLPIGQRLEDHFGRRVRALPADSQMLLLLAAADSSGSTDLVWRAASLLGVAPQAAERAEADGLLTIGAAIRFRHPLIRAAVYRSAPSSDRRAAHRALAEVTSDDRDERRAWHLAEASFGPDEDTAAMLEQRATDAAARGRRNAAAALLSRAAELTPVAERATGRFAAAAAVATDAASPHLALALLERAHVDGTDTALRANALRVEGVARRQLGQCADATDLLLEAAELFVVADPSEARWTLLEALQAAHLAGRLGSHRAALVKAITVVTESTADTGSAEDILLRALAAYIVDGFRAAVPQVRSAVDAIQLQRVPTADVVRWNVIAGRLARSLWDQQSHEELLTRMAHLGRVRGDLPWLATALQGLASNAMWRGEFTVAESFLAQASDVLDAIAAFPGQRDFVWMEFRARQGDAQETLTLAESVIQFADALGLRAAKTNAQIALAHLYISCARYADAKHHAVAVFDDDPVMHGNDILDDLIEAAVRTDDGDLAHRGLARLTERAEATGSPWALGVLARCRALVHPAQAEDSYHEAITLLATTRLDHDLARTHLLYGEWLRREKRRSDARVQLRVAYEVFAGMGAAGFAQRTLDELRATGEHARRRSVETASDLTPQETHIADLAASGDTNAEIAAHLYISVNTVEYHLRKIFRKLDITSRRDLRRVLPR